MFHRIPSSIAFTRPLALALLSLSLLSACGGGGGSSDNTTPIKSVTPTPAPQKAKPFSIYRVLFDTRFGETAQDMMVDNVVLAHHYADKGYGHISFTPYKDINLSSRFLNFACGLKNIKITKKRVYQPDYSLEKIRA